MAERPNGLLIERLIGRGINGIPYSRVMGIRDGVTVKGVGRVEIADCCRSQTWLNIYRVDGTESGIEPQLHIVRNDKVYLLREEDEQTQRLGLVFSPRGMTSRVGLVAFFAVGTDGREPAFDYSCLA